ncbi:hypothetical protein ACSSS7_005793 [Eimeria intestinalis]
MPVSRTAAGGLSLHAEEFFPLPSTSSPFHLSAYDKGGVFPLTEIWAPHKRYRRWFSAVGTLLAVAGVVFLISYCRGRVAVHKGSNLVKRKLGGADEGANQGAKEQKHPQVCGGIEEPLTHAERASTFDPPQPLPAPAVLRAEGLAEGERPQKRTRAYKPREGYGLLAKVARLSENEAGLASTSVSYSAHESTPSRADLQGAGVRGLLDFSQSSGAEQRRFEGSESPADHGERSSEGGSRETPAEMVQFILEASKRASEHLALGPSSVDLTRSPQPSSPLLPEELLPELLTEDLEAYILEASGAEEGALLESWILDPEAPMPPSPVATSADEIQELRVKGSVGGYSSLGIPVKSDKTLAHGQKPSPFLSGSDESKGASPDGLHKAQATMASKHQAPSGSQPLGEPDYANHPFYHLPAVPLSVLQGRDARTRKYLVARLSLWEVMNLAGDLLAKPALFLRDVELLQGSAEVLLSHATSNLQRPLSAANPSHFAHGASIRFLIADILWCAWEVLGGVREEKNWFGPLMEKMLSTSEPLSLSRFKQRHGTGRVELISKIFAVADAYKAGERPSAKDVVEIKQLIFCGGFSQPIFNQRLWDRWREADRSFWAGQGQ